jgi:glutaredoxin-like protein
METTSLIPKSEAVKLKAHLDKHLTAPVTIDLFTKPESPLIVPGRECEACEDTRALVQEVAALSDNIALNVHDFYADPEKPRAFGVDRIPAIVLRGAAKGQVRYIGIPAGYEFASFLEDLGDVSGGETDLSEETKTALKSLDHDVHIQVFVTPTCPFCPGAARLAHKMAVESERVTADVVEASEFPDLVQRYSVQGVPKTVVNDTVEFVGAQPEARLLEHVLKAAEPTSVS